MIAVSNRNHEYQWTTIAYHYDQKDYSQQTNISELFAVIGTQHRFPVGLFLGLQQQRFPFAELFKITAAAARLRRVHGFCWADNKFRIFRHFWY